MLIDSYDSCWLSGGWMGPGGWIFELGKWTGRQQRHKSGQAEVVKA